MDRDSTIIGKRKGNFCPDIVLNGIGIRNEHCKIEKIGGNVFIIPNKESEGLLFLNGKKIV